MRLVDLPDMEPEPVIYHPDPTPPPVDLWELWKDVGEPVG